MSALHAHQGLAAGDTLAGYCYVPSMGWFVSGMPPGQHRIGAVYHHRWFGTGRFTWMGTEICTSVRFNGQSRPR